jgi:hypothetical protein
MKNASELTREWQQVSRDELDTCANYARLINSGVEIRTLYRFGKPHTKTITRVKFYELMNRGLI